MSLIQRLAELYRDAHQYAKAVETTRQIADLEPSAGPGVSASIVATYRLGKDFAAAQTEANAAIKKYPKDRAVIVAHAEVVSDLGRVDEAASEIRTLLNGERDLEVYKALAQTYEKGKNFAEVEKALDAAGKLAQSKGEKESVTFMRGAMFEKQKKYSAAETEFRKVIESNPQSAGALNYLGYMLADRNIRLEEAHQLISKAVEIDPDNGAYLDSLGWVLYKLGRYQEALPPLRRAVEIYKKEDDHQDAVVLEHLADVLLKLNQNEEAIQLLQQALLVDPENKALAEKLRQQTINHTAAPK